MKVNTYLNFGGNCEEAFRYYEKHLGGKILMMTTFGESSGMAGQVAPEWASKIMHGRIELGDTVLMGNDVPGDRHHPMRSVYISLSVESSPEAERIFEVLSKEGEVFMPMQETFFAHRFAMLRDQFGTLWMVIHERARH
jgi:PhnB protein